MKTIGMYEARTHFSELINRVAQGETITVTRNGVAIARITPVNDDADDALAAMEELHRFRRERRPTLGGITIRELVEEGRV